MTTDNQLNRLDTRLDPAAIDPSAIDPEQWPDVAQAPSSRLRAFAAERIFVRAVRDLRLSIEFPDGRRLGQTGDAVVPRMIIRNPRALYQRIGSAGLIGFGEAFMAGDWTTDDLVGVLTPFAERIAELVPAPLQRLRSLVLPRHPGDETNTVDNTRSNISRHYDLSNQLFEAFLDETLSYSSALFDRSRPLAEQSLEEAQAAAPATAR